MGKNKTRVANLIENCLRAVNSHHNHVNCIAYSLETSIVISIALRQFTRMNLLITPNTETTESTERMSTAK